MAKNYPMNANEFRRIPGVGEKKLRDFGEPFLKEIKDHLASTPAANF
jgi:superfamily II DNA helicase RecQ